MFIYSDITKVTLLRSAPQCILSKFAHSYFICKRLALITPLSNTLCPQVKQKQPVYDDLTR